MKPVLIIAISLLTVSLSGQAGALSLESCTAIHDPLERLACYDKLAGYLPADTAKTGGTAPGAADPAAPGADVIVTPAPAVEPAPDAEALFGFENKQKPDEKRPGELQLKWVTKEKDAYGKWIITLENGQVWRQTDSRRFSFINSEQCVVISRGTFGSFFLGEPGRSGGIRVKRVE